jgi:hypothetical protein
MQTSTYPLKVWRMAKWLNLPPNFIRKTVNRNTEPPLLPNRCYAFVFISLKSKIIFKILAINKYYDVHLMYKFYLKVKYISICTNYKTCKKQSELRNCRNGTIQRQRGKSLLLLFRKVKM